MKQAQPPLAGMYQQQQGRAATAAAAAADSSASPAAKGPIRSPQQRPQPRSRAVTHQQRRRPLEQGEERGDPRTARRASDRRRDDASRRFGAAAAAAATAAAPGLESENVSHGLTMRGWPMESCSLGHRKQANKNINRYPGFRGFPGERVRCIQTFQVVWCFKSRSYVARVGPHPRPFPPPRSACFFISHLLSQHAGGPSSEKLLDLFSKF